ncbi:hypothetical protein [Rubinisphaera brasiliensis]|uniref:Uncharacterized protein n=1 Tax=Rubinisphaera brasiliensis (strain ATCC 49424 / DSM 5305 / JCM 21570 / IAM 15109 / NBRC 103401 / IFAM 1448) TaxID=756272 RepID=F0SJ65_RUBBR|nr:hypothetical protein [Rubinisphaera brasiliensis]ADY58607.1 hypothetical protein Plabr_0986 [Rubinisphaera brasiliensis DSM 5305]
MLNPYSRGKRLSMEETVMVHEWLKKHEDIVKDALPHVEQICRRVKVDLGFPVTPNAIERLIGKPNELKPVAEADNSITGHLIEAIEHLYDQLGEERPESLVIARQLIAT